MWPARVCPLLCIGLLAFFLAACDGPAEEAGEKLDETVEETKEQIEEAQQEIEEAREEIQENREELSEAQQKRQKAVQDDSGTGSGAIRAEKYHSRG